METKDEIWAEELKTAGRQTDGKYANGKMLNIYILIKQ